ncbi:MAG: AAA domain-containing protein [Caldithrix sp.]|nr:AAA domain-containing protein [Caldithrix sp.]
MHSEGLLEKYREVGLLGKCETFKQLLQTIDACVKVDVRVLLEGQSGTGKERIARAIHNLSPRRNNQFVAIDCGAIPGDLLESELFGHVKGAFTGAVRQRKGLLQEADGGTMFLDEVANLSLSFQAKFLRFLQENEIRPVGSNNTVPVQVRIISASSQQLDELVIKNAFRQDLYYRLNVYPIHVPSLSERRVDIAMLARHFLRRFSDRQEKQLQNIDAPMIEFFKNRPWPGNIREMENLIERLVTLVDTETNTLPFNILPQEYKQEWQKLQKTVIPTEIKLSLEEKLAKYEKHLIHEALMAANWNQSQAARYLAISEQTMRYKMKRLHIGNPQLNSQQHTGIS